MQRPAAVSQNGVPIYGDDGRKLGRPSLRCDSCVHDHACAGGLGRTHPPLLCPRVTFLLPRTKKHEALRALTKSPVPSHLGPCTAED